MTTSLPPGYVPPSDLLAEHAILVTGAGQGLGRAVALACAAHGATVALLGRTPKKLEATADAIEAAGGAEPGLVLAGDFTDSGYPATLEGAVRSGISAARTTIDHLAQR